MIKHVEELPKITDPDIVNHVGYQYMIDVLNGRIVACQEIKWACLRQYNDLLYGHERGLFFSSEIADIAIDALKDYKHFKGEFAGEYFDPTPPQIFCFWCLFGWLKEDGSRRFTEIYKCVARKNGKSFEAGVVGAYMFEADGESGAECYTVANKLKQARIVHENVKAIINETPSLNEKVKILRDNLSIASTYSKFEPLGRDSNTEDGLNPHYVSYDEFHAAPDNTMYEVIDSAFGARLQPLFFIITTAGVNPQGPCYKHQEYCRKVLNPDLPDIENDSLFILIYTLDPEDDCFNEDVWIKSNPNLPYIPTILTKLRSAANKAKEKPSDLTNFKTKHMNIWCSANNPWVDMARWVENNGTFDSRDLIGKPCYAGLDLASVNDLTSLVLTFPPEQESIAAQRKTFRKKIVDEMRKDQNQLDDYQFSFYLDDQEDDIEDELGKLDYIIPDPYRIIPYFFVPVDNIRERSKAHGVNYDVWMHDKSLNFFATPGPVTDYSFVEYEIDKAKARFDIREIAYDPYNASYLVQNLINKQYNCVEIVQNWSNMSWASKEFEMLYLMGLLSFNNDEVLTWNASNVVIHTGPSGNYKPDKAKSSEKIDGIIALIMALNRAILNESEYVANGNDGSLLLI